MIGSMNRGSALRAVSLATFLAGFGPTLAMGQQGQEVPETPRQSATKTGAAQGNYSAWVKVCTKNQDTENKQVCLIKYEGLDPKSGDILFAASVRIPEGEDKRDLMINVPTAYSLMMPAGARIKIDQDEPISLKYTVCLPTNCLVQTELTNQVLDRMRKGKQLLLAAINIQQKALTFSIPLDGFAKAFDGAPVDFATYQLTRSRMLEFAKKSAADQQANSQGATPAQPADPNARVALPNTAPPPAPQ
jgi:invasion protein IalB